MCNGHWNNTGDKQDMKKIIFVLSVLVVFVCLFVFRVPLIQRVSPEVARYYGFEVSRFEVSQFDINKIVIPMLAMQQVDGALRTKIEIRDLVVDIDTFNAEVSAVSSRYVDIDIENLGAAASDATGQGVSEIVNLLPVFGLSIEDMGITYRVNGEELVRFEGGLSYAQSVTLKGEVSSGNKFNLVVDVFADDSNFTVNAFRHEDDKVAIDLSGNYQVTDDWLDVDLEGDLSFQAINQFIKVFGVDEYVNDDDSHIKGRFELDLTRPVQDIMQSFAADLSIDSTLNVSSKSLGVKQAQIDVSASCRAERLENINCLFKDPQRAVMTFFETPDWLNEYFDNIGNEFVFEVNPGDQLAAKLSLKEILFVDAKGNASFNIRSRSAGLEVSGVMTDISANGISQDWQLEADYKLDVEALDVISPVKTSRLLTNAEGKLSADEEQANIQLDKGSVVNALHGEYEGYVAKTVRLELLNNSQFDYRYLNNQINVDDVRFDLVLNRLTNADAGIEVSLSPIQMQIDAIDYSSVSQHAVAHVDVNNILLVERGIPVKAYEFNAGANLKNNQFTVDGGVGLGQQKNKVNFYASHNILTATGRGTVNADTIALLDNEIVSNQISESGFPLQLTGGNLGVNVDAVWNTDHSESEITVKLLAEQIMGDYAQNQFSGLNAALEFVGKDGWSLKQAANLKVDEFNIGVPVENVSMRLERVEYGKQEKPLIHLSELSAGVLDGSIYSEKIEIDLNQHENMFTILMTSLSLEKLIALNQTQDLKASGIINGKLPMKLVDGVLLVDEGSVQADEAGGYIKYARIGEMLAGNQNLQLVGDLLKDFRYNEMSAQVDLIEGGRLTLATKLHGRSPSAELNKQVNLNFNIELNLWKFLESARLLGRIDQDVTRQILSRPK
tara:strand:+ start:50263 stop:52953 length:2691 start_codon:yes stop_codon:yes gene_type:complete